MRMSLTTIPSRFVDSMGIQKADVQDGSAYAEFANDFETKFRNDMDKGITGSPMPFLNDANDFNNLFGNIYVDSICILPNTQTAAGPSQVQYNDPEVCWVDNFGTGRVQSATLRNPIPVPPPTTEGRMAKGLQVHGSEACFQTGGQSACSIVISFQIAPTWRSTLGPLSTSFDFLRQVADRAGSFSAVSGSFANQYGTSSVSAAPTIRAVVIPAPPSGTAALRPFLSLVAAAVLVFL